MGSMVFPQLSSGAQVQYPLRKRRVIQSALNSLADGSIIASNINSNSQLVWDLSYIDLVGADQQALQNFAIACQGALRPFTFIDPTDNMLSSSSALNLGAWIADPLLVVTGGAPDPLGGETAFTLVNSAPLEQRLTQQILAPANFQYCFSVFASAAVPTTLTLSRSALSSQTQSFAVSSAWNRLVSSVRLADNQLSFSVSMVVPPAQTVLVWGPQLEPQAAPSRYRSTAASGGVYQNAHLIGNSITFESHAPGLYSAFISIETT